MTLETQPNAVFVKEVDLGEARDQVEVPGVRGNYVWAIQATSGDPTLDLHPADPGNDGIPMREGLIHPFEDPVFDFFITNSAQAGETMTLEFGFNRIIRALNPIEPTQDVALVTPQNLETPQDVTLPADGAAGDPGSEQQILPAQSDRDRHIVQNHPLNTNMCRVGAQTAAGAIDNDAGTGRGTVLEPGDSISLKATAEIVGRNMNDTADDSDVQVTIAEVVE